MFVCLCVSTASGYQALTRLRAERKEERKLLVRHLKAEREKVTSCRALCVGVWVCVGGQGVVSDGFFTSQTSRLEEALRTKDTQLEEKERVRAVCGVRCGVVWKDRGGRRGGSFVSVG